MVEEKIIQFISLLMREDWSIIMINEKHWKRWVIFHFIAATAPMSTVWVGWWVSLAGEEAVGHMHQWHWQVCKTWGWPKARLITSLLLSHTPATLYLRFLYSAKYKISTYLFYLSLGLFIPLAYGYFPWMVKWSLFKRIIFITHVGMLEIRNGLGTGGTLHSHGIVFCVLQ